MQSSGLLSIGIQTGCRAHSGHAARGPKFNSFLKSMQFLFRPGSNHSFPLLTVSPVCWESRCFEAPFVEDSNPHNYFEIVALFVRVRGVTLSAHQRERARIVWNSAWIFSLHSSGADPHRPNVMSHGPVLSWVTAFTSMCMKKCPDEAQSNPVEPSPVSSASTYAGGLI